jgi:hypothetical protein
MRKRNRELKEKEIRMEKDQCDIKRTMPFPIRRSSSTQGTARELGSTRAHFSYVIDQNQGPAQLSTESQFVCRGDSR